VVGIGERAFIGPLLGETVVGFIVVGIGPAIGAMVGTAIGAMVGACDCDGAFDCAFVGEIVVGFIVVGLNASESEGEVVGELVEQVPQVTGQFSWISFSVSSSRLHLADDALLAQLQVRFGLPS